MIDERVMLALADYLDREVANGSADENLAALGPWKTIDGQTAIDLAVLVALYYADLIRIHFGVEEGRRRIAEMRLSVQLEGCFHSERSQR